MSSDISEDLRIFIRRYINSVALLEVLFMLKRNPERIWTPEEVSAEMRTNPSYAKAQLEELLLAKLVASDQADHFHFSESTSHLENVQALEVLYNNRRSTVINYIYSQPIDSIRDFANAFKIKKD